MLLSHTATQLPSRLTEYQIRLLFCEIVLFFSYYFVDCTLRHLIKHRVSFWKIGLPFFLYVQSVAAPPLCVTSEVIYVQKEMPSSRTDLSAHSVIILQPRRLLSLQSAAQPPTSTMAWHSALPNLFSVGIFWTVSIAKRYKQSSFPTKANFLQVHHHRWTTATDSYDFAARKLWLAITFLTYRVMERFCPVTFQVLIPFLNGFYKLFNRQMNNINLMDLGNILSVVSS